AVIAFAGAIMLLLPVTPRPGTAADVDVNRPLAIALALVLGFFGGMVGIAGIAFLIAALVYLLRVPPRIAIGPSLRVGPFSRAPLLAVGLHPRVARDVAVLGVAGALSIGRFAVLVPADEAWRAREVLQEPEREPPEENVILQAAIIAGGLLALLLAAALLAGR